MSMFMYTLAPILGFALLGGLIKFRIYKKSISTFIITLAYVMAGVLFYNGYIDAAVAIVTVAVLAVFFRAVANSCGDTFFKRRWNGEDRRGGLC